MHPDILFLSSNIRICFTNATFSTDDLFSTVCDRYIFESDKNTRNWLARLHSNYTSISRWKYVIVEIGMYLSSDGTLNIPENQTYFKVSHVYESVQICANPNQANQVLMRLMTFV